MPIFEYKCPECGAGFEKLVNSSNRDNVSCPECGSPRTDRQLSTFAAKSTGGSTRVSAAPRFT